VSDFVTLIRFSFCGDLIDKKIHSHKPVIIYPSLNINEDVYRDLNSINNYERLGNKIVNNLTDVSIYLGGECDNNCIYCDEKFKQIKWCNRSKNILNFDELCVFLSNLKSSPISSLSFYGGNPFSCPFWQPLLLELRKYTFDKFFYFDYRLLSNKEDKIRELIDLNYNVVILIGSGSPNEWEGLTKKSLALNTCKKIKFVFSIENDSDFSIVSDFIFRNNWKNVQILPYYNKYNKFFFEKEIYLEKDDILSIEWTKKNIFSHQIMNINYFGKLILFHDGNVYSNLNGTFIGRISDSVKRLVYNEITNGIFWRKTRDTVKPCKHCLYKYLCPSPSNYELAIGKSNLCHVKP
jgi:pseudo-rSAM protein